MPELKMNQNLKLVQTQKLVLTQKIRQALEILQLPSIDLENLIRKELQENPLLEKEVNQQKEPEKTAEDESQNSEADSWDEEPSRSDSVESDPLDILKRIEEHTGEYTPSSRQTDDDSWIPEPPSEPTLSEYLLQQVYALMLPSDVEDAVVYIVYSLNRHGLLFLTEHELEAGWDGKPELLTRAIEVVKSLEPTGVGAGSEVEALEMQLIEMGYTTDSLECRIITTHFDEMTEKKIKQIAGAENVSPHVVQEAIDRISIMNPWPGNEFSSSANAAIIPDIIIIRVEDHFEAVLNDNRFPRLMISARNRQILESPNTPPKEKEYVVKKFQKASWFIKAIAQRQETVTRIGNFLAEYQSDFFEHGIEGLRPLTLQIVADALGYNQSTISRAINGKYLQSPRGIYKIRFFFSRALPGEGGDISSRSVKDELKKLIRLEDKKKPLSDAKLVLALEALGIRVKRRTVANYRLDMNIPSARQRRRY